MHVRVILVLLVASVLGCSKDASIPDDRRVLLTTEKLNPGFYDKDESPVPAISTVDADAADAALRTYLHAKGRLSRPYAKYLRQYAALLKGGKRHIVVNGLCGPGSPDEYAAGLVTVHDGGDCYFRALVDVESRALVWFRVNGDG